MIGIEIHDKYTQLYENALHDFCGVRGQSETSSKTPGANL
jgi:hypothetical protein